MPFTIKVVHSNTLKIKRLYVDPAITYDALVNTLLAGIGADANTKLCILYVDTDNDYIGISNSDDLKVAIDLFNEKQLLKIFVNPHTPPPPTAEGAPAAPPTDGKCPVLKAIDYRTKTAVN
jgi:hypothetical protein